MAVPSTTAEMGTGKPRMPGQTATEMPQEMALFSSALPPRTSGPARRLTLLGGLLAVCAIAIAGWIISNTLIGQETDLRQARLEQELDTIAASQAAAIADLLQGAAERSERIVGSELFQLFATEVDLAGGDVSESLDVAALLNAADAAAGGGATPLIDQLPFMERVLTDFVIGADFLAGYLFARNGVAYVGSGGAAPPGTEQSALTAKVFEDGKRRFGPARAAPEGLTVDMALPVLEAQTEPGDGKVVGVMLFTLPVSGSLAQILAPRPGARPGEAQRLIQRAAGSLLAVRPGESPPLQPIAAADLMAPDGSIPFARRGAIGDGTPSYSIGWPVPATSWSVVQEIAAASADAELKRFAFSTKLVAALVVAAAALAVLAFWWWLGSSYSRAMAKQYHALGNRIAEQKQLLDRINGTVADHIAVKDADGTYRFANAAFAAAVGRSPEQVVGLDDAALFGHGTAERFKLSDQRVLREGQPVIAEERVYLRSVLRHLQISKTPLTDTSGAITGVVAVARDVTELVEARDKRDKAVRQAVSALVLAIELRDPYLSGHSQRVSALATDLARCCGASAEEIATLETAAALAQIGKLFVPRELLTKPERLSEAERAELRAHIGHAESVLRGIDFGLPVLQTIRQMHERIDGAGYPRRLRGSEISFTSQVLGLCDWFCARVAPRGYRPSMPPEEALDILERNPQRYAPQLVAQLRQVVTSVAGEKLLAGAASH
ncbi:MAG: HD domain-containing phosphohydrolase [Kiloniellales bacterium]